MADGTGGDTPDQPDFGDNPFANLPMFAEMAKALSGQGPLNWDAARQFATMAAGGSPFGSSEPNIDPAVRIAMADLARILELHVRDLTGADVTFPEITPVTRTAWAQRTLDAYRPLFTELATSLGRPPAAAPEEDAGDPMMAMMAGLSKMMAPAMMGMAVGSMVGRMAQRTFGQYDLPIPRSDASLLVVPANIDGFATEWSLPVDEMRLWVLAQEMIGHTLFTIAPLRDQLTELVRRHVGGFSPDPSAVAEQLSALEGDAAGDPMQAIQQLLGDPALLLGAVQSPEQQALAPRLDAAVAAVVGAVDYLVDAVAVRVIGGDALRIAEAVRRRRVETSPDDLFVQRLLGLQVTQGQVQRGKTFVGGVVDRVEGAQPEARLVELLGHPEPLPTPAEIDAPGLWLARLEL
ncbi:MAG: zinc-dependent metalloprotease [Acidimicrobiaceae bacterium]|nr:zinc-dependent metalloprotease [Ilumatobacter sp.]MCB9382023.1 zinc-dependent metalloprotease [Acidimicrobiaceae bacterium]MCO5330002.1 zinc-dependent metalloprotease [Ilumatobacteraceae bacterium]